MLISVLSAAFLIWSPRVSGVTLRATHARQRVSISHTDEPEPPASDKAAAKEEFKKTGKAPAKSKSLGKAPAKSKSLHAEVRHAGEPHEHNGSPGEGGAPMVPRTHTHEKKPEKTHEWTYAHPIWGDHFPHCSEAAQSPIDIDFGDVTNVPEEERTSLDSVMGYEPVESPEVFNHGHNVQVNGNFGVLELPDGEYEVRQFHFHFPSEHTINGQHAAGEIHIVHQKKNSTGTEDLAVVGILLQETWVIAYFDEQERQPELDFLSNLGFGTSVPEDGEERVVKGQVDLNVFAREFRGPFFHYFGSLTTPPCSETVHWYVLQEPAAVTHEMVKSFKAIFPSPTNNRPTRPLNGRTIGNSQISLPGEYETSTRDFSKNVEEEASKVAEDNIANAEKALAEARELADDSTDQVEETAWDKEIAEGQTISKEAKVTVKAADKEQAKAEETVAKAEGDETAEAAASEEAAAADEDVDQAGEELEDAQSAEEKAGDALEEAVDESAKAVENQEAAENKLDETEESLQA